MKNNWGILIGWIHCTLIIITTIILGSSCKDAWAVEFACCEPNGEAGQTICLSQDTLRAKADGVTVLELKACIPKEASSSVSQIKFTIPQGAGTLEGGNMSVTKTLDDTKAASVLIKAGRTPGIYKVQIELVRDSKTYVTEATLILDTTGHNILTIVIDGTDDIRADNTSFLSGYVLVDRVSDPSKEIILTQTGPMAFVGVGNENEIRAVPNQLGRVDYTLKAGTEQGQVFISAKYDNFSVRMDFPVQLAKPDEIALGTDKSIIKQSGDSVKLEIFLKRNIGEVSEGIVLKVFAMQILNGDTLKVGQFDKQYVEGHYSKIDEPNAVVTFRVSITDTLSTEADLVLLVRTMNDQDIYIENTKNIGVQ